MNPALVPLAGFFAAALIGCAGGAPTQSAAATPSPSPSPAASYAPALVIAGPSEWTFGAIEAVSTPIESQVTFQKGIDFTRKPYGTGQSYYLTVGGQAYQLHFQSGDTVAKLKVGDTVNLHPSGWYSSVKAEDGTTAVHVMFNAYKGSRAQGPIDVN